MKITLSGIEHDLAQGQRSVYTIEKYKKNIELNRYLENGDVDANVIPFDFQIPRVPHIYLAYREQSLCYLMRERDLDQ